MTDTPLPPRAVTLDALAQLVGTELGVSSWRDVTQELVDRFAAATGDDQYIHVDPVRAAATPLGGTIAHGFLTLSLLSSLGREVLPQIEGRVMGINYGFESVRFLSPVRTGSRIRARFALAGLERRSDVQVILRYKVGVEIEGTAKPALAAEWMTMAVFG